MSKYNYQSKQLIILGNGFDINLGLTTKYSDFINSTEFVEIAPTNALCRHLLNVHNIDKWIDLEKELKIYSQNLSTILKRTKRKVDLEKKSAEFKELCTALKKYLLKIDYGQMNLKSEAYKLIKQIRDLNNTVILDFNYTKSTQILLNSVFGNDQSKIRHYKVHGDVNSNIVVGVEDDAEMLANFYKKSFPYYYPGINFYEYLNKAFGEIIFFGYSLGETDHSYFRNYFNFQSDSNLADRPSDMTVYYYDENSADNITNQLFSLTSDRVASFRSYNNFKMVEVSSLNEQ